MRFPPAFLDWAAAQAGPALRLWLRRQVAEKLEERQKLWHDLHAQQLALGAELRTLAQSIESHIQSLDRAPIAANSTVHAAHRRHPGVQALFAERGLPHCLDCAVGADETIEEAAFGEGMPMAALLRDLNALLLAPR